VSLQNGGGEPKPTHPLPRKRHFEEAIRKNHDFFRGLFSRAKKPVGKGVLTPEVANRSTEAFMRYVLAKKPPSTDS